MTLQLGMLALTNVYGSGNVAAQMAGISAAIVPVLVFFLLAQRQIIESLMAESLEG